MPLSATVGRTRKISKNFQSSGLSIALTAELDSTLLTRPEALQEQIANLYAQAAEAMDREEARMVSTTLSDEDHCGREGCGNGQAAASAAHTQDRRDGRFSSRLEAPMTTKQSRAIGAIASRLNVDPQAESRNVIGFDLHRLTVPEASKLIDHLNSLTTAAQNGGA